MTAETSCTSPHVEMSALYSSCWSSAVAVALRVTGRRWVAEEIAQDVLTWFWQNPDRYDPARGSYRSLISTVAHNRAVDWQRSESARSRRELAAGARSAPCGADDPRRQLNDERVLEAVMALPRDLREPIHLAFWCGLTYREVASHLGIPEGTAKSRLRSAQLRLRAQLSGAVIPVPDQNREAEVSRRRFAAAESRDEIGLRELFAAMPARYRMQSGRRVRRCAFMDHDFVASSELHKVLIEALDAVLDATGTTMGKVQLCHGGGRHLRIEAQRGFEQRFIDYFASVREIDSTSGYPLQRGQRIIIRDVAQSRVFPSEARDIVLAAGARAVQSTPLIGSSGRLLGLLSTHHDRPRRPEALELRFLDLVALWMARTVERRSPS